MKSIQWKSPRPMTGYQIKVLICNEKQPMKGTDLEWNDDDLQWKVVNENTDFQWIVANEKYWHAMKWYWPAMKSGQWKSRAQWKAIKWKILIYKEKWSMKRTDLQWNGTNLQWKVVHENPETNEKLSMKSGQWKGLTCNDMVLTCCEKWSKKILIYNEK